MSELKPTQTQLEDSTAVLQTIAVKNEGLYVPDKSQVPRPSFALFQNSLEAFAQANNQSAPVAKSGRIAVGANQAPVLASFAGLRGMARIKMIDDQGQERPLTGPAILLEDGRSLAVLTAETPAASLSEMQQALLEAEYVKSLAQVKAKHNPADVTNAGDIAPALVIASTAFAPAAHSNIHGLATQSITSTFATRFSRDARQDLVVGTQTRTVRSAVVPIDRALFYPGIDDQIPAEARLLGPRLTAGELAVGMTLAATESRTGMPNLQANLQTMVGA